MSDIERARVIADDLRSVWPEKAAEIDRAIAAAVAGQRDGVSVSVGIRFKLEKFEGEIRPDSVPFETIEGEG